MDTRSVRVAVLRGMLPMLEWKEPLEARTQEPRPLSLAKLRGGAAADSRGCAEDPRDDIVPAA
jgi:hypothetical protein